MDRPVVERKGELKVFLGYAPGVGKTYTMLDAADRRQAEGLRVLPIGFRDSESAGPSSFPGSKTTASPFDTTLISDLDQVIQTRPDLVLIDDLTAQPALSSRHQYRYQDIQELLDNGIDVYTTMDVYQLESLRDAPWQCETLIQSGSIPDTFFDMAAVIEVIDIPPMELIQRLKGSPSFVPDSMMECLTMDRLTAMREAALRSVAGRARYKNIVTPSQPMQNKILVCVSAHPLAERLVRAGRRMADEMNAEWQVLYIETPDRIGQLFPHSDQLRRTLDLAKSLGADVMQRHGHAIAPTVLEYARDQEITRIIIGNPHRTWYERLGGNTVIDQVLKQAGPIEVFVIGDDRGLLQKGLLERFTPHSRLSAYIKAAALILLATLISYPLHFGITVVNVVMIYLASVTISAIYWGRGPSLLASGLSVLVIDFLMIEPKLSLTVESSQYLITLLAFFLISLIVSNLAVTIRVQVDSSRKREIRTSALYNLSRELSTAMDLEYIAETLVQQISNTLGRDAIMYYESNGTLQRKLTSPTLEQSGQWQEIVSWVLLHHQAVGFGTATYSSERVLYLPIYTNGISQGVLGIWLKSEPDFISLEEKQMLEAYANLAGLAMERVQLMEQANRIHISKETEKLQSALLNSLSHDLRTPLSSVIGSLSTLKEVENNPDLSLNGEVRTELVNAGLDEAERMNRLIGNLLDMTRLESGAIHLKLSEGFISDVVASAIRRLNAQSSNVSIQSEIPADLPPVQMDITLIEQVVVNLLDNAIKYSAPGGLILVTASQSAEELHVSVSDEGPGIPFDEIGLIFEKFYRGKSHDRTSGSGLGLAICKGFVEAHGGQISASNNPGKGVAIAFSIPLGTASKENKNGNQ